MRIAALDGFRALAIFMVMGYHYFTHWASVYPYGDAIAPVFSRGYLGVWLFFMVSGFVIALTLERCATPREFVVRRFARVWPPMVLCSVITYIVLSAIPQAPFEVRAINFLPSVTFIDPRAFSKLFGLKSSWMDGAYWSLFVEVRFYFWAALLYFGFRRHIVIPFLVLMNVVALTNFYAPRFVSVLFDPEYLPFFGIGLGFYHLHRDSASRKALLLTLSAIALGAFYVRALDLPILACFVALFCVLVIRPQVLAPFGVRPVAVLGESSYSLYLLHQFIGVSLIAFFGVSGLPGLLTTIVIAAGMTGLSILVYRTFEVPARELVKTLARRETPAVR